MLVERSRQRCRNLAGDTAQRGVQDGGVLTGQKAERPDLVGKREDYLGSDCLDWHQDAVARQIVEGDKRNGSIFGQRLALAISSPVTTSCPPPVPSTAHLRAGEARSADSMNICSL